MRRACVSAGASRDSTGLKLCGAGEWLLEKHSTQVRRSWRKLPLGITGPVGRRWALHSIPASCPDCATTLPPAPALSPAPMAAAAPNVMQVALAEAALVRLREGAEGQ